MQVNLPTFDEAIWYSMYGPDVIMEVGPRLWQWESEGAWLLHKERGEELSTDISDEETPSTSQSSQEPMHRPLTAAAQPHAPTAIGAQSELSRAQHRKKSQQSKARKSNLAKHYQCAESEREYVLDLFTDDVIYRFPNPRYTPATSILHELEDSEKNLDPEVRAVLKKQLMDHIFIAVHNQSFSPAIGDQLSRLAVQFTRKVPQASFRKDTPPRKSETPQAFSQGGTLPTRCT